MRFCYAKPRENLMQPGERQLRRILVKKEEVEEENKGGQQIHVGGEHEIEENQGGQHVQTGEGTRKTEADGSRMVRAPRQVYN